MNNLHSINKETRLYVIKSGPGFSCLGFDYAESQTRVVANWLGRPDLLPPARKGTKRAYASYLAAMREGANYSRSTGSRCNADLIPELIPFERKRVEVTLPNGEKSRFIVGKSGGWLPCHLEIKRRDSSGGCAVYFPVGATVRAV
jgi:hypothetical protein